MSSFFAVYRRPQAIGLLVILVSTFLLITATAVSAMSPAESTVPANSAMPNVPPPMVYAKPGGLTSGLCDSWANACELRYALTNTVSGQEIWVAQGTYTPTTTLDRGATFQLKSSVAVYGGFAMTETLRSQRNPATNVTILSGDLLGNDAGTFGNNDENSYRVVTGATGATLDGFIVRGGNADDPGSCPGASSCGGGMYNNGSDNLMLSNLTFSGNWAFFGGGMTNIGSSLTLTNVTFSGNSAGFPGGGIYNDSSSLTLTNVTFSGNSAASAGGMQNNNSNLTLTNATFSGNAASLGTGGGMVNNASSLTLTNVTFNMNTAFMGGGGMLNASNSNPTVRNSIFWGDTGGEITNNNSAPFISNSVVQGGYISGTNIITADPLLGPLGNYGGSTQTIPLLPGSSAIGGTSSNCPATDQRGIPRDIPCDIGAYELIEHRLFLPMILR
jgi:predicted outer membrane repeat protein